MNKTELLKKIQLEKLSIYDYRSLLFLNDPPICGIYFLIYLEKVVYIGCSLKNPKNRIKDHKRNKDKLFDSYFILQHNSKTKKLLLELEAYYIFLFQTKHNVVIPISKNCIIAKGYINALSGNVKLKGTIINQKLYLKLDTIKYVGE